MVNPLYATTYSSLVHDKSLPKNATIKIDMKVNSLPASDMGIFIKDTLTGSWKNAYLFGLGYAGAPNSILLRDSNNIWGNYAMWNPTIGTHHIEVNISGEPNSLISIKEDDTTLLTWTSTADFEINETFISLYGTGSEFANYEFCSDSNCEAPTPTPTPTPPDTVVLLPGLGGSWNSDAMLNCKETDYEGDWIIAPFAKEVYNPIMRKLEFNGYTPQPFYYDWRRPVTETAPLLKGYLDVIAPDGKVYLVGHSLGGLVSRAYLEQEKISNKVDTLV
ncbi:MAG: hypothetical protein Q7S76_02715, partial [bacterium]|nr:hypothetical protein [bacterium]